MSRDLQQKQLESTIGATAQHVDVDAEHDPKVARRASNAALGREAIQHKAGGKGKESAHAAAERGVQSPATALPHADKIQSAFGAHDVSHIKAHVGDGSAAAMGAQAYATGNHVVFDKEPDLHTAAHEAAHVVQQAQGVNLYGGVGKAGDTYERNADEVADRVVQGKSAEDLLGTPSTGSAQAGVVQAKAAPSQMQADGGLLHAIQAHAKLTAARMHAGAVTINALLKSPTSGDAGTGPLMQQLDAQITMVNDDVDALAAAVSRVPNAAHGQAELGPELGAVHGAFHQSWAPALNRIYSFTRDENDKVKDFAQGYDFSVTTSRTKIRALFRAAGVEETELKAELAPRIKDNEQVAEQRDDELKAAELDALRTGMSSVEIAVDLIKADLHSSVSDQSKEALDLMVAVEQLAGVFEQINPDHIGKIAKLPLLIKQVEELQAEVMKMKEADEDKGKALAPKIGYNTQLSRNLFRLKSKIAMVNTMHKANAKHHH